MKKFILILVVILFAGVCSADSINTKTGEYLVTLPNGDAVNTASGDYHIRLQNGDMVNTKSGEYIIKLDKGMVNQKGEYYLNFNRYHQKTTLP